MPTEEIIQEVWKPIILNGVVTDYDISNFGEYRSNKRVNGTILKKTLRGKPGRKYFCAFIYIDGVRFTKSLHRLVAIAFIPNPENKPEVNHKKGDKLDNRASELEWATKDENIQHSFKTGLHIAKSGKTHYKSKRVGKFFAGILLKTYDCLAQVYEDGYWNSRICYAIRDNKNYRGFFWKYI